MWIFPGVYHLFAAQLSENALTAVSLSFPLITIMNATSVWIGVGINVFTLKGKYAAFLYSLCA